ncbi:HET-domain-containing protein [Viridothelium virens]|uniref:HET-domain-containing protein n=1 Tax=Viridothelium virens TaxID=1048519 RepID=A0A6A6GUR6_VIRVR|nr:HET-domain-containing protein [Viridothelium virens]
MDGVNSNNGVNGVPRDDAENQTPNIPPGFHRPRSSRTIPDIRGRANSDAASSAADSTEGKALSLRNAIYVVMKRNRQRRIRNQFIRQPGLANQSLCGKCRKLDLTAEKFVVQHHGRDHQDIPDPHQQQHNSLRSRSIISGSGNFELGTFTELEQKRTFCPFCRLVFNSATGLKRAKLLSIGPSREAVEELDFETAVCYASWQIDGRIIVRDGEVDVETRARTRRIRIHWKGGGFQDSFLILIPPPAWASGGLFLGRYIGSARHNGAVAKSWVDLCCESHGSTCRIEQGEDFHHMRTRPYFGVIDVENMCLTPLPENERYIALSYTWGDAKVYKTTLKNVAQHRKHRGLEAFRHELPQTISDAIDLVKRLGERYLWVDALCIIQEPEFSKSWELNSKIMDAVYGNAFLTICAADGDSAAAGLVGLSGNRRVEQAFEDYAPGVRLMVAHLGETYIEDSAWNKRAWTFQERLLSRRCLIFTQGRMYFQCRSTTMSEDIFSEDAEAGWSLDLLNAPLQRMRDVHERPLRVYQTSVPMYTDRILGRPDDIMAAFYGIGKTISTALGGHLLYCLPNTHFDWALLWEPVDAPRRRYSEGMQMQFPSWSWCGWDGSVMDYKPAMIRDCLMNLHEWLSEHTWIVWYIRDAFGILRLVWDSERDNVPNGVVQRKLRGYKKPQYPKENVTYDNYGRIIPEKYNSLRRDTFDLTLPEYPYSVSVNPPGTPVDPQMSDLRFLQFWTWSAFLRLERRYGSSSMASSLGRNSVRVGISDCKGDWCGTVVLDYGWINRQDARKAHEFIALSDARAFDEKEEHDDWTFYIPISREQSEWDLYFVMLVEKEGDVSRRVGIGKVFKQAFFNSFAPGKDWREFILE